MHVCGLVSSRLAEGGRGGAVKIGFQLVFGALVAWVGPRVFHGLSNRSALGTVRRRIRVKAKGVRVTEGFMAWTTLRAAALAVCWAVRDVMMVLLDMSQAVWRPGWLFGRLGVCAGIGCAVDSPMGRGGWVAYLWGVRHLGWKALLFCFFFLFFDGG